MGSSSILGFQIPAITSLSRSPDRSSQSSPFINYRKRISFSDKSPLSRTGSPRYHECVASSLTSRFESLYHNAIATRRCHDQIRRQADKFKEKHALDGCTFNPRLISRSYTPKQVTPRQREMETMNRVVERMRRASAIREEKLKYTSLRNGTNVPPKIASAPFSFGDGRKYDVGARLREDREKRRKAKLDASIRDDPVILVEVTGDDGESLGKITIRKADDLLAIVTRFCDCKKLTCEQETRLFKRLNKLVEDDSTWPLDQTSISRQRNGGIINSQGKHEARLISSLPPPFDPTLLPVN